MSLSYHMFFYIKKREFHANNISNLESIKLPTFTTTLMCILKY